MQAAAGNRQARRAVATRMIEGATFNAQRSTRNAQVMQEETQRT